MSKIRQYWLKVVRGKEEGFEDLLQRQVSQMAREEFGMEL
jgi:aarF domain-containing kinase